MERLGRPRQSEYFTLLLCFCAILVMFFFYVLTTDNNERNVSRVERKTTNHSIDVKKIIKELKLLQRNAALLKGKLMTEESIYIETLNENRKFRMKMMVKRRSKTFLGGIL